MTYALGAVQLDKSFVTSNSTVSILRNVTFTFDQGSIVAIMGPSGSGKTTLLHLLAGLDQPSSGEVWWGDTPVHALDTHQLASARRKHIGLVFQDPHLLPEISALENVLISGRIHGKVERSRGLELLDAVGMSDRVDAFPATLSGGERQRVAVARALYQDPPVLLADEPTGSLDQRTAQAVSALLIRLARTDGRSVVLVTHDSTLAAQADKVYELDQGELKEIR